MDPDDERCKSGPLKTLNISQTLCYPYLATLVGITLCNVIMSQNGDIAIWALELAWHGLKATWETLLDLGKVYPIGHLVNPPISKLGK